jgi:hypothetical protein
MLPRFAAAVKWLLVLLSMQTVGCSNGGKQASPSQSDIFPKKWGLTSEVKEDWKLQGWTLGKVYPPGDFLEFGVRLIYIGERKVDLPSCHLEVTVIGPAGKPEETRARVPALFERVQDDPPAWEAIIQNPFPAEGRAFLGKENGERAKYFGEGEYLLKIHALINDAIEIELEAIPFRIEKAYMGIEAQPYFSILVEVWTKSDGSLKRTLATALWRIDAERSRAAGVPNKERSESKDPFDIQDR